MPLFVEAIQKNPTCRVFRVDNFIPDQTAAWQLTPLDVPLLTDSHQSGMYLLSAYHIISTSEIRACYINMCMPECFFDYMYTVSKGKPYRKLHHQTPGDIIPAVAIDFCSRYNTYYSKMAPQVGIDVLKQGLAIAQRQEHIAANLGYIYRDEKQVVEAIEMFELAVQSASPGGVSEYHCAELVHLFRELGDETNEEKYAKLAPSLWIPGRDYFPKCEPESMLFPIGLPAEVAPELFEMGHHHPELRTLATGVANTLALDGLYALADALEESGYSHEKVLNHLRGGYHPPESCLVLDWMLGKKK